MDHRINVDNLKILRDFLRGNYDMVQDHLDMQQFCTFAGEDPSEVVGEFSEAIEDCGTTLCLAGWSAVIPEFQHTAEQFTSYPGLTDRLFSPRHWVFSYLFGGEWNDDLDEGIQRISTLIHAVEADDEVFLHYLAENAEEIQAVHGRDDDYEWVVEDIEGIDTLGEAKEYFSVYTTPTWFLEASA